MKVVFLIGGIGSGKSTVARELERRGAVRIDLDQVSREVLMPGSPLLPAIAQEFGEDLIDESGVLNRGLLAQRVFCSAEATERLEAIELPAIRDALARRLDKLKSAPSMSASGAAEPPAVEGSDPDPAPLIDRTGAGSPTSSATTHAAPPKLVVVEVPLPDRAGPMLELADAVVCVACPLATRRIRAIGRGMDGEDFDRRAALQLTDAQMEALADVVIDNSRDEQALQEQLDHVLRSGATI